MTSPQGIPSWGQSPDPGGSTPARSGASGAVGRFLAGGISTDAAVGRATPNPTYLGKRLQYEKTPEGSLDPLSSIRYTWYLARQYAIFFWVLYPVLYIAFLVFFIILTILTQSQLFLILFDVGADLTGLAFLIAWLVIPIPVILSEWKFLVDDKGAARPIVFDHITYAFRRRGTPVDSINVRRLSGGVNRDFLEVKRGVFAGYISCFEEGNDLYVGWTYWLRMAPWRYGWQWLVRYWHVFTFRADDMYVTLRYETAKSLRESLHGAAREGIDVAVGRIAPEGQGILQTMQVLTTDVGA
jgi:hypothetical protein